MLNFAVVRETDNVVINKIVAASADVDPPLECFLVPIDGVTCDMNWVWTGSEFVDPNPPVAEGMTDGN